MMEKNSIESPRVYPCEENQVEALCVQNTTFEEFCVFFPFQKNCCQQPCGQLYRDSWVVSASPVVARTVAPNLFRRMYSVAWPQVRRSNQLQFLFF